MITNALELERRIESALAAQQYDQAELEARQYLAFAPPQPEAGELARTPWFRAQWLAAQVSLSAGRLAESLSRAEPLLPCAARIPDRLACRLWLLVAEARARLQLPADAVAALAHVLAPRLTPIWQEQPLLWLRVLRVRLWLGEVRQIADELQRCDRALSADPVNRALLRCEAGRAWEAVGEIETAEECWRSAASEKTALIDQPIYPDLMVQLGRLSHLRGHLQAALDHYEEAEHRLHPQSPQLLEVRVRRLLVWLDLNQEDRARAAYAELLGHRSPTDLPEENLPLVSLVADLLNPGTAETTFEGRAFQAARAGDRKLARALYRHAFDRAVDVLRQARLALTLGLLALEERDVKEYAHWLALAEQFARAHDLPEVLWRALDAFGRAAAEVDRDDQRARAYFEEAVRVSEGQVRQFRHATDAASYHLHRAKLVRMLLRGACRRGDAAAAFHYQELERGKLLYELYQASGRRPEREADTRVAAREDLDRRLSACEEAVTAALTRGDAVVKDQLLRQRDQIFQERDRLLDEFLTDRTRRGSAALPAMVDLDDLRRTLPPGLVYVAPNLIDDELFLLVARGDEPATIRSAIGNGDAVRADLVALRQQIDRALEAYQQGQANPGRREALDQVLERLGHGPLGALLSNILQPRERLLWVAEGSFHGLPVASLRRRGRYLVEQHDVVQGFSGALWVHQARAKPRSGRRWGPSLVVTETPQVLPQAQAEGDGVQAALFRGQRLQGAQGSRARIRPWLTRACVVHFACHALFDPRHALAGHLRLPSGEDWRTLEWVDEPLADLPLVTLSACRSAELAPLLGNEVFGLVTGVMASGVRAAVAGLWSVPDAETVSFMWRFYRNLMTADLATALAITQRQAITDAGSSPLFWAVFALFGDPQAIADPGWWGRWWGHRGQARHRRRFPTPDHQSLASVSLGEEAQTGSPW